MNEFEYLSQMRALRRDCEPERDVWINIAGQLEADNRTSRSHPAWSIAAAVVLSVSVLFCQHMVLNTQAGSTTAKNWQPQDPRFSAAAIELAAAREQLTLAMVQNPDGQYLHKLLARTDRQQQRIQQWAQM